MPDDSVTITGPDGQDYQFPSGTDKNAAIAYFKAKGIGMPKNASQASPDPIAAAIASVPKPADPMASMRPGDMFGPEDTNNFSVKVGDRIRQNLEAVPHALTNVMQGIKAKVNGTPQPVATPQDKAQESFFGGNPDDPTLTRIVKAATVGPRMVYEMGKSWTQDPANAVGDIVSGYVAHQASAPENVPDEAAIPKKLSTTGLSPSQQADYTAALDKANSEHTQALQDYAEKEADARAKWVQKTFKAKQSVADQVKAINKKQILDTGATEYAKAARDNIQSTHDAVRASLDNRWNSLRDAMQGTQIPAPDLFNAIQNAKTEFLRGSPASLKQFNDLTNELGIQNYQEDETGGLTATPDPNATIPWDTARVHSTALGQRLASGGLPGNVYQALKFVQGKIEDSLANAADQQGRADEYSAVRRDWSQYMNDWKDTSSVNRGGSPLAVSLQAPDVGTVQGQILGNAGDRMIGTLAKYRKFGARPDLLASARNMSNASDAVKIPTTKAAPPAYEPPSPPELKSVPRPQPEVPQSFHNRLKRTAIRAVGKTVGGATGSAVGHPIVGYAVGGEIGNEIADRLVPKDSAPAVPGRFRRLYNKTGQAVGKNTPSSAVAVGGDREVDPDAQAINDAHENIQDFINSLPQ